MACRELISTAWFTGPFLFDVFSIMFWLAEKWVCWFTLQAGWQGSGSYEPYLKSVHKFSSVMTFIAHLTENVTWTWQHDLWCKDGSSLGHLGVQMGESGYPFWLFAAFPYCGAICTWLSPKLWEGRLISCFLVWRPPEMGILLYCQLFQPCLCPFLHNVDNVLSPNKYLISVRKVFVGKDIKYILRIQSYCIQWYVTAT